MVNLHSLYQKEEDKTITFSAKNIPTSTFWSPGLRIDTPKDDISQWIYHEEPQLDPPLMEYFSGRIPIVC